MPEHCPSETKAQLATLQSADIDYFHCMQCTDRATGKVGDFIHAGDFIAISPVFDGVVELVAWMRANGWESIPHTYTNVRHVATACG